MPLVFFHDLRIFAYRESRSDFRGVRSAEYPFQMASIAVLEFRLHIPVNRLEVDRDAEFSTRTARVRYRSRHKLLYPSSNLSNKGIIEADRDALLLLVFIPVIDF